MHDSLTQDVVVADTFPPDPAPPEAAGTQTLPFHFTGSGKEYFRIWIINLLLTVATLGIYSAWAKVRRLQYFYRNTELAGATFDFHGNPKAILKGRLLAAVLVAAYHYAFGISLAIGVGVIGMLIVALPFLTRSALRFRLSNTSYRGLRFSFNGSLGGAYLAYFPPIAMVLAPGFLLAIDPSAKLTLAAFALYLAWPAMHGAMKRYQHRNLQFGDQPAQFGGKVLSFYRPYLLAFLMMLSGLVALVIVGAIAALVPVAAARLGWHPTAFTAVMMFLLIVLGYLSILSLVPYVQARIYNLAWSNTTFPGVRIDSALTARGLLRVHAVNTILTLLTLGLYRPFAVVRVHRYRLAHVTLQVDDSFETALAGTQPRQLGATGDGAADFFGVDLSW